MVHHILVASYTNEVSTLAFDPEVPSLTLSSAISVGHHPSWITPHPTDESIVFTALEQADGRIIVLKLDDHARATQVGDGPSGGADPCTLVVVDDQLLLGNYSSGVFNAVPLSPEPPHVAAAQSSVITFTGTGPNAERQEASHPHQVIPHPTYKEVLVPDLGADKTHRLVRDADGKWLVQGAVSYKPGSGPRHVAFYDDVLYTLLELSSELSAHRLPPLPAEPTLLDTVSTMAQIPPPEFAKDMLAAEILIPPPNASLPDPYIYVSNRNDPSSEGDTIAIFSPVDAGGKIGYVAEVRSGLNHLRGMVFGGPDDRWLIAGGPSAGESRGLKEVAAVHVDRPTGFLWL
ncbi:putative isomerase YbhE [Daedaleopsis nitida]|nr:putative isomerase YbhE [Daedaleopsis nitida]